MTDSQFADQKLFCLLGNAEFIRGSICRQALRMLSGTKTDLQGEFSLAHAHHRDLNEIPACLQYGYINLVI